MLAKKNITERLIERLHFCDGDLIVVRLPLQPLARVKPHARRLKTPETLRHPVPKRLHM
jgi:hypothetical protein